MFKQIANLGFPTDYFWAYHDFDGLGVTKPYPKGSGAGSLTIGLYCHQGGCVGEFGVQWKLYSEGDRRFASPPPQLQMYGDSMLLLQKPEGLALMQAFGALGAANDKFTKEDLKNMLDECGFYDMSRYAAENDKDAVLDTARRRQMAVQERLRIDSAAGPACPDKAKRCGI